MSIFNSMRVSATGLTAEHFRLDVISNNIANANTTRTDGGGPFRRQLAVFSAKVDPRNSARTQGVRVERVIEDQSPLKMAFNPGHPDADAEGYVTMPNIEVVSEMVDMISATRSYEANINALKTSRQMLSNALSILR